MRNQLFPRSDPHPGRRTELERRASGRSFKREAEHGAGRVPHGPPRGGGQFTTGRTGMAVAWKREEALGRGGDPPRPRKNLRTRRTSCPSPTRSRLLDSEHAAAAGATSSCAPSRRVPDQERPVATPPRQAPNPQPHRNPARTRRGRKGGRNAFFSLSHTLSEAASKEGRRGRGPEVTRTGSGWLEPSGGCESRSRAASRIRSNRGRSG